MSDRIDKSNGRRGFLKKLLGLVVAPKVAAAVPEKPVDALWKKALADYESMPDPFMPLNTGTALKIWMGEQKAREMREHLLEGKPLPMHRCYGPEFEDAPEEEVDDDE